MDKTTMLECLINNYTDGNKAAFAKMLGINPQLISHWLRRNTFDNELLFAKCKGISASWLLTGEGEMFEQTRASVLDRLSTEYDLSREQRSVIEAFLDLDPQERDVILKYVHKVYDKTHSAG